MSRVLQAIAIAVFAALIASIGMAERPLSRSSEGRVARVAQEMLEDGDWIVPHLSGEVRLEKPPLSSWLVALTALACGAEQVEAWHALLPVAVCTVLLLVLIFYWMSSLEPPGKLTAGLLAAFVLGAAPGFISQARSAELDMLLALEVAVAFYGFWRYRLTGSRGALLLTYAALALSVLTKGHVGLVMVLPALLLWSLCELKAAALPLPPPGQLGGHVLGGLLLLGLVLPWGLPFISRSGITWDDFAREGLQRFGSTTGHQETVFVLGFQLKNIFWYLYHLPGWFLPWSLLLPAGLWLTRGLAPDAQTPLRRLCWCWLGWNLILFSLMSAKQRHYAIPFFAPFAMLTADALLRALTHSQPQRRKAASLLTALVGLGAAVTLLALGARNEHSPAPASATWPLLWASCGALLFIAGAGLFLWRAGRSWLWLWCAGSLCYVALLVCTEERAERSKLALDFCAQVKQRVPAEAKLYDYGAAMVNGDWRRANFLFYLGRRLERPQLPLSELLKEPGVYVLVNEQTLRNTQDLYEVLAAEQRFLSKKYAVFLIRSR